MREDIEIYSDRRREIKKKRQARHYFEFLTESLRMRRWCPEHVKAKERDANRRFGDVHDAIMMRHD